MVSSESVQPRKMIDTCRKESEHGILKWQHLRKAICFTKGILQFWLSIGSWPHHVASLWPVMIRGAGPTFYFSLQLPVFPIGK